MAYTITLSRAARRQLSQELPEAVAAAAWEFINGALRENPHRVGNRLNPPYDGIFSARRGSYRIFYSINDSVLTIAVIQVEHRRDAYRT